MEHQFWRFLVLTIEKSLTDRIKVFLTRHSINHEDGIIVAFSGGADSLSLLSLLATVHAKKNIKAVYVNHLLRGDDELKKEIEVNKANCALLSIESIFLSVQRGEIEKIAAIRKNGIEEAARFIRYKKLEELLSIYSYSYIATGHTQNDVDETLLMRVFQGSRHNLSSPIHEKQGSIIRPMLNITRSEIDEYIEKKHLEFVEDSTNSSTIYLRNKIRHTLIPVLDEVFPSWNEGLYRISDEMFLLNQHIEKEAKEASTLVIKKNSTLDEIVIDIHVLSTYPIAVIRRVLYSAYNQLSFDTRWRLSSQSVDDIVKAIHDKKRNKILDVAQSTLIFSKDEMKWRKGKIPLGVAYFSLVYSTYTHLFNSYYLIKEEVLDPQGSDTDKVWIDESVIVGALVVRSCQEQDTIELKDGTKKVSSLLASWHIHSSQRWQIPLLVDDIGVLAVMGRCFLGKDRVAKRAFTSPLARKLTTLYSVLKIEG